MTPGEKAPRPLECLKGIAAMAETTRQQKGATMNGNLKWWANWGLAGVVSAILLAGGGLLFQDYREQQKTLTDQIPKQTEAMKSVSDSMDKIADLTTDTREFQSEARESLKLTTETQSRIVDIQQEITQSQREIADTQKVIADNQKIIADAIGATTDDMP